MGLDAYNRIFEGYDPNYNPEDDPDVERNLDRIWEIASETISDAIDLTNVEDKIESMSLEDKILLLDLINSDYETIKNGLEKLGAIISLDTIPMNRGSAVSKLTNKQFNKLKREILEEKLKNLLSQNSHEFAELIHLEDIIKYPIKYRRFLDKGIHFSIKQIMKVVYSDEFRNFIAKANKIRYNNFHPSFKIKLDISKEEDKRIFRILTGYLTDYYKSLGYHSFNFSGLEKIFEKLKTFKPLEYEHLLEIANPINYIK
jgi:hypothetical protein